MGKGGVYEIEAKFYSEGWYNLSLPTSISSISHSDLSQPPLLSLDYPHFVNLCEVKTSSSLERGRSSCGEMELDELIRWMKMN